MPATYWTTLALTLALVATTATAEDPPDTKGVFVKRAIAERMTPAELEAYKQNLARTFAGRRASARRAPDTPGDSCPMATLECLPFPSPQADSTTGAADNYDLPADTTTPTCTAATTCTGAGPAGSLPRGAIYTGTGTGPDRAWRIQTPDNCAVTITADPTSSWDLALIVYEAACSNLLSDCVCVDDTGIGGDGETVTLQTQAGLVYYIVVDGYSSTPPGPSGPYTLNVTTASCGICPVELHEFSVE